jgi:hypothetical protein
MVWRSILTLRNASATVGHGAFRASPPPTRTEGPTTRPPGPRARVAASRGQTRGPHQRDCTKATGHRAPGHHGASGQPRGNATPAQRNGPPLATRAVAASAGLCGPPTGPLGQPGRRHRRPGHQRAGRASAGRFRRRPPSAEGAIENLGGLPRRSTLFARIFGHPPPPTLRRYVVLCVVVRNVFPQVFA